MEALKEPWDVEACGARIQSKRLAQRPSLNAIVALIEYIDAGPSLRALYWVGAGQRVSSGRVFLLLPEMRGRARLDAARRRRRPRRPRLRPRAAGERVSRVARCGVSRPRLLDLFCGAGGAAMGYHRAGFEVVGVDIKPQPHYPFEFHQADALTFPLDGFDAIHASPPCQFLLRRHEGREAHGSAAHRPDARTPGAVDVPWVLENVHGAAEHMSAGLMLCGSMFGLAVERHRLFEFHGISLGAWPPRLRTGQPQPRPVPNAIGLGVRRVGDAARLWRDGALARCGLS